MSAGLFLAEAQPVETTDSVVTVGFPAEFAFHKDMLEKGNSRQLVEDAFEATLGRKFRLQFVVTELDRREMTPPAELPAAKPSAPSGAKLPDIITEALGIFEGSKIVRAE